MKDFLEISSKENPLIKLVGSLQTSARARTQNGFFVLEGLRICRDAFENAIEFDKLIITRNALEKYGDELERFSSSAVQTVLVPETLMKRISDTDTPQGVLVVAAIPKREGVPSSNGRYIALENLADPSNLGAISRTAEALGLDGILLSAGSCDPYSPKSLRASMGTLLRVPLFLTDDLIGMIRTAGLRSLACVVDRDADSIGSVSFADGDVLLIGNEANGLTEETKRAADFRVTIPMRGRAESLNAAAAAAIAMWEMRKGGGAL